MRAGGAKIDSADEKVPAHANFEGETLCYSVISMDLVGYRRLIPFRNTPLTCPSVMCSALVLYEMCKPCRCL